MKLAAFYRLSILLFLSILVSACSFSLAEDITPPPGAVQAPVMSTQPAQINGPLYPLVPPDPANGAAIYTEKCAPCHGVSGMGDGSRASQLPNPVPALGSSAVARQATPSRWYTQVTQGNLERFMPPFASLSNRERWDVVAYALTLSVPQPTLDLGAELYQANCAGCHGEEGRGDGPQAASLAAKPTDFTNQQVIAQTSAADIYQAITEGVAPEMPAYSDQLSDDQRWSLAAYLRTLTFASAQGELAQSESSASSSAVPGEAAAQADAPPVSAESVTDVSAGSTAAFGTVSGSVVNASGGEVPAGLEVTLRGFDEMSQVITATTALQEDGSFTFNDIEMPSGRAFMATVKYQENIYGSDIAVAQAGDSVLELPVSIFETTTDTSILIADRLHLFFEFVDADTLRVIQLYILSNPTNMTLVPASEGQPTVSYRLPEGAANLEFQDGSLGERFIQTADGFGDTASIRPGSGTYEVLFAFEMPYDRKLDLVQPISVPVNAVVVMVPEGGVKIKSDMLIDEGTRDVQGAQYRLYNGSSIAAGSDLRLTISGRPTTGAPQVTTGSSTSLVIGLGGFGLALVLAGVWLYRRTRTNEAEDVEDDSDLQEAAAEPNGGSAESLMDAIIALDDLYQAGELPEGAYLERRTKLKVRLKDMLGN